MKAFCLWRGSSFLPPHRWLLYLSRVFFFRTKPFVISLYLEYSRRFMLFFILGGLGHGTKDWTGVARSTAAARSAPSSSPGASLFLIGQRHSFRLMSTNTNSLNSICRRRINKTSYLIYCLGHTALFLRELRNGKWFCPWDCKQVPLETCSTMLFSSAYLRIEQMLPSYNQYSPEFK